MQGITDAIYLKWEDINNKGIRFVCCASMILYVYSGILSYKIVYIKFSAHDTFLE
jgi:hypothetical protein